MWTAQEIKSQLVLKNASQAELAKKCGLPKPTVSIILTKTQLILPELVKILGENPFILENEESKKREEPKGSNKSG